MMGIIRIRMDQPLTSEGTLAMGLSGGVQLNVGSSFDWQSLLDQLATVETQKKVNPLKTQQATLRDRSTKLSSFLNLAKDVENAAKAFKASTVDNPYNILKTTFSNADQATALGVTLTQSTNTFKGSIAFELVSKGTATRAVSNGGGIASALAGTSGVSAKVNNQTLTTGNFTVFANGTAHSISVGSSDTIDDVLGRIDAATGSTSTVLADGKIQIATAATTFDIGASGDTSNFASALGLSAATLSAGNLTSLTSNNTVDLSADASTAASGLTTAITAGTFSINGTQITIAAGDSVNDIITKVNSNSGTGVTLSFDTSTNSFVAQSKTSGNNYINFQAGTSNFLTAAKLDNTTSTQTLGSAVQFKVNGGAVQTADSANIDLGNYGYSGVKVNVTNATNGTTYNFDVGTDTDGIKAKINDFVDKYNKLVDFYEAQTKVTKDSRAALAGNSLVRTVFSNIRQSLQDSVGGITLASVGISTGALGSSGTSVTQKLSFNESTFSSAFASNPTKVQTLFDTAFTDMTTQLSPATLSGNGLIANSITALNNQVKTYDTRIQSALDRIDAQRKISEKRFMAMDEVITRLKSQASRISAAG